MSVLSIRIKDNKRKLLKVISALEETTISNLVESWIDDYLEKNRKKYSDELSDNSLILNAPPTNVLPSKMFRIFKTTSLGNTQSA